MHAGFNPSGSRHAVTISLLSVDGDTNVSMTTVTVSDLARTLGLEARQVLDWFASNGWDIQGVNSTLSEEQIIAAREAFPRNEKQAEPSRNRKGDLWEKQDMNRISNPICVCCEVEPVPISQPNTPEHLPTRPQRHCSACLKHLGSDQTDLIRKENKHKELWRLAISRAATNASRDCENRVSRLNAKIQEKEEELTNRSVVVVHENLDQDVVDTAIEEKEKAFGYRNAAFGTLTLVKELHREMSKNQCRCGLLLNRCKTHELLTDRFAENTAVARWEAKEYRRLKDGLSHSLPLEHPALKDGYWQPYDFDANE